MNGNIHAPSIVCREGANYYWYHRTISNFEAWAPCSYNKTFNAAPVPLPPGWELLRLLYIPEPGTTPDSFVVIPIGVALKRDNMMVILVRDAQTSYELMVDASFQYSEDGVVAGKTHSGFSSIVSFLFYSIDTLLMDEVVNGRITSVAVAGHSFGAGVAAIMAPQVQV